MLDLGDTAGLVALRCRPADAGAALRELWTTGAAVLLLAPDAPAATTAAVLASQRPAWLLDLVGDAARDGPAVGARHAAGAGTPVALADPLPVADDVALVVATSGSTGRPKGVELTHAALRASTEAGLRRLRCRAGERWALALPTHHVAGVQVLLRSWALGVDAEVVADLGDLATCGAAHVSLVPTQLTRLLELGVDVAGFATILLGGARADPGLLRRARAAGANVIVSYGMTESCGGCVYDGVPLDGVELDVADGRVRLRGRVLFRGYRGDAAATREVLDADGWFTTGDRGRLSDGRLEVLGRADDVIVSGGENVPSAAVEASLRLAPGVADVAVVGRPDPEWGELVVAVVVASDPGRAPTLAALREHVRAGHPASHAPRDLVLVDALPRDAMGKLSRDALLRAATRA